MQLILSNAPILTRTNQLKRYSKGRTTGIDTPWHLLVPRSSYMKMPTREPHGHPTDSMPGSLGPQRIITAATSITSLRLVATTCLAPPTCFPNIALPQHSHPSLMCRSWLADELQATLATMQRKRHTSAILKTLAQHLDAYVTGTPPLLPKQRVEDQEMINNSPIPIPPEFKG